jgi:hypothetical protein
MPYVIAFILFIIVLLIPNERERPEQHPKPTEIVFPSKGPVDSL